MCVCFLCVFLLFFFCVFVCLFVCFLFVCFILFYFLFYFFGVGGYIFIAVSLKSSNIYDSPMKFFYVVIISYLILRHVKGTTTSFEIFLIIQPTPLKGNGSTQTQRHKSA